MAERVFNIFDKDLQEDKLSEAEPTASGCFVEFKDLFCYDSIDSEISKRVLNNLSLYIPAKSLALVVLVVENYTY